MKLSLAIVFLALSRAAGIVLPKENADETSTNSKSVNADARRPGTVDGRTLNFGAHTVVPQDEGGLRFENGEVIGAPWLADQLRVEQIVDGTFEVRGTDIACDDVLADPAYLDFVAEWSGAAKDTITLTCVSVDGRRRLQDEVAVVKLSYAIGAATAGDAADIVKALGETEPEAAWGEAEKPKDVEVGEYSEQVAGQYTTRYEFAKPLNIKSFSFAAGSGGQAEVTPCCCCGVDDRNRFKGYLIGDPFPTTAQTVAPGEEALVALPKDQTCLAYVDITVTGGLAPATEMNVKLPPRDVPLLMVPDSNADRIVLFDRNDGALVDRCFIDGNDGVLPGPTPFNRPINAIQVGSEIWVSDQNADTIFRFDLNGVLLSLIDEASTGYGMDNLRGLEYADPYVYLTVGSPANRLVVFDTTGAYLGYIEPDGTKFMDVLAYQGKLYLTDISNNNDRVMTFTQEGPESTFIEAIATSDGKTTPTSFDFLQQISVRGSDGTLLAGGFSTPRGIYNFGTDGTILDVYRAGSIVRAAYELGNGKILWSSGDGTIVLDLTTNTETEEYSITAEPPLPWRPSMQYIEPLLIPSS